MKRRIVTLVVSSLVIMALAVGYLSHRTVSRAIERSINASLSFSGVLADRADTLLERNINLLSGLSLVTGEGADVPALRRAYEGSLFTGGIAIVNNSGQARYSFPLPPVGSDACGKITVSGLATKPGGLRYVTVCVPLENGGEPLSAVGTILMPDYRLTRIMAGKGADPRAVVELIDSAGRVIASNGADTRFTHADHNEYLAGLIDRKERRAAECHSCHSREGGGAERRTDMMAFTPLAYAPWGVAVTMPYESVYAPAREIRYTVAAGAAIFTAFALLLAFGLGNSIVTPLQKINRAVRRISDGDLERPVNVRGQAEVDELATGLERMRLRLKDSLESVRRYNEDLEEMVYERTGTLRRRSRQRAMLLERLQHAQEEERRRVARDLHDETSQSILALRMALDAAAAEMEKGDLSPDRMRELRARTDDILAGVKQLIHDLRPPVLDDLGFASSVKWLLDTHLVPLGITVDYHPSPAFLRECERLRDPSTELRLFRVLQEAVLNIRKHADARQVRVTVGHRDGRLYVKIEDDGKGFKADNIFNAPPSPDGSGYGLLGMRERVENLNGHLTVTSAPEKGTRVDITVPVATGIGGENGD